LTFASPILFPGDVVGARVLALLEWNPFTHFLRLYRAPLDGRAPELVDIAWVAASAALGILVGRILKDRFWWTARDRL
jgi:lipopolysaccharide transport system permease protein